MTPSWNELSWRHVYFVTPSPASEEKFLRDVGIDGFVDPYHPEKDYRLRKALYGLKQAPRAWTSDPPIPKRLTEKHLKEVKRIFRYLRGTINMGLCYLKDSGFKLTAFSYADHAGCIDTHKSTSGGIQFLGDKVVGWMSKKQDCTAMSLAKVEYVALFASFAQVMWMMTQLKDYGFNYNKISLYCDSHSAIAISCNLVQHSRTNLTRRKVSVSRPMNWYEMFDSRRTGDLENESA
ncbi:ribonuclease H-like domain-containing protein [Tanacetum coccineum]